MKRWEQYHYQYKYNNYNKYSHLSFIHTLSIRLYKIVCKICIKK
jgi:hypothetical protein